MSCEHRRLVSTRRAHCRIHSGARIRDTTKYLTTKPASFADEPLVILVDGGSAASEIVAGAIQTGTAGSRARFDHSWKGSVQQVVNIDEYSELKLTMAAWHTPSGRSIDKRMRKDSTLV